MYLCCLFWSFLNCVFLFTFYFFLHCVLVYLFTVLLLCHVCYLFLVYFVYDSYINSNCPVLCGCHVRNWRWQSSVAPVVLDRFPRFHYYRSSFALVSLHMQFLNITKMSSFAVLLFVYPGVYLLVPLFPTHFIRTIWCECWSIAEIFVASIWNRGLQLQPNLRCLVPL